MVFENIFFPFNITDAHMLIIYDTMKSFYLMGTMFRGLNMMFRDPWNCGFQIKHSMSEEQICWDL